MNIGYSSLLLSRYCFLNVIVENGEYVGKLLENVSSGKLRICSFMCRAAPLFRSSSIMYFDSGFLCCIALHYYTLLHLFIMLLVSWCVSLHMVLYYSSTTSLSINAYAVSKNLLTILIGTIRTTAVDRKCTN